MQFVYPRSTQEFTRTRPEMSVYSRIESEYAEKNPRHRDENQQQTQPTCDARSGNRTRATLVGGERSHHCADPALLLNVCTL